ncbi:phage head morphogenesis protein [Acinetobacter bereziniae]|uniref:phage head morphogenesis protein n=1 Tax=Acinetobacter bereziniae TaxID=106648 RepID=UPI0012505A70|nr:phage head morphogenesis protein [Acinetobacter bereziniae]
MNNLLIEQAILDALNQHNSYLQRLSSTSVNEILKSFDGLSIEMLRKLRDLLDDLNEAEKASLAGAKYNTSSLKGIQEVLGSWQQSISTVLPEILDISMIALASYESSYIYKLANKRAPVISGKTLLNKAKKTPYAGGQLLDYIFPNVAENVRKKAEYVIRDGISNGQTNFEVIKRIKGTKPLNYTDGILNQTRNVIDAEVRTARAHISSEAYATTWIALGFEYTKDIATLDGRTTMLCASRDGRVQKLDASHQRTPYHFRCRTAQIGCDKDGKLEAMRPFVADNRPVKDIPKDQRDGKIGQVDANTSYKKWFESQGEVFQREWLGEKRYELYKNGGYTIDKFIDPEGKLYTLKQLERLDAQTIKELGFE